VTYRFLHTQRLVDHFLIHDEQGLSTHASGATNISAATPIAESGSSFTEYPISGFAHTNTCPIKTRQHVQNSQPKLYP
jgi:hypothetical protein